MSDVKTCGRCGVRIQNLNIVRDKVVILENINLDLPCGEFTALIGRNGAGKTTLLKAILQEIHYKGDIIFVDHCGCGMPHARVGYVPQQFYFDSNSAVSVSDFLLAFKSDAPVFFGRGKKDTDYVRSTLSAVECESLADRRLCDLSGGEIQRVMLSVAISPMPDLLILDEPVSGIDQRGMDLFYRLVSQLQEQHHVAILLVSHDFTLVKKYASNIVLVDKTVLTSGKPETVFKSKPFISAFGDSNGKGTYEHNL